MWKEIVLGLAVLAPAAASQLFQTPQRAFTPPAVGASFKPSCRDTALPDSRSDPAWLRASFAHDNCREPQSPVTPEGARASRGQIVAGMAAVKGYAKDAAHFQACVAGFVTAGRLTSFDRIIENHRILASQKSAIAADVRMRGAIEAFNAYGSGCDDP